MHISPIPDTVILLCVQTCFNTIRTQLGRCDLEHFELGGPADLNPLTPDGLLAQMHAANLLGVLEVVLEDVIMEARQLKEEQGDRLVSNSSLTLSLSSLISRSVMAGTADL